MEVTHQQIGEDDAARPPKVPTLLAYYGLDAEFPHDPVNAFVIHYEAFTP